LILAKEDKGESQLITFLTKMTDFFFIQNNQASAGWREDSLKEWI